MIIDFNFIGDIVLDVVCSKCGCSNKKVFLEAIAHSNNTVIPICIDCKSNEIKNKIISEQIETISKWEEKLKLIEQSVANDIIELSFPNIKFKSFAKKLLIHLMQKYSIRIVFEVCCKTEFKIFNIKIIEKEIMESICQ